MDKKTILVVEDDSSVRISVATTLEGLGYRALQAGSAFEALAVIGQCRESIDLLLIDVVMPRIGGPALVRAIKSIQPSLRVLYMSGAPSIAAALMDEQPEEQVLLKPFNSAMLAEEVQKAMS